MFKTKIAGIGKYLPKNVVRNDDLKEGEVIAIEVSVQLIGNAIGIREGGILQHILHKLDIECLPSNIPSHFDIDISQLNIGDSIKVSDVKIDSVKILNDEHASIVAVVAPTIEKEPVAADTETPAEPEVITKSKKEDEE